MGETMPPLTIAVLTDVHANLPALEAALAAIAREGCAAIYHTGDAIGIGPYPAECLDRLLHTTSLRLLLGNHDAWFAHGLPVLRPAWMGEEEYRHQQWTHAQLAPALRATVAAWPVIVRETFGGVTVRFQHYALDRASQNFAPIVPAPTAAELDRLFAPDGDALICYGHHHPASDVQGRARYLNPGALGCHTAPLARFALLTFDGQGSYQVQQRAVPYDPAPFFAAFAERDVPARAEILRAFFGQD